MSQNGKVHKCAGYALEIVAAGCLVVILLLLVIMTVVCCARTRNNAQLEHMKRSRSVQLQATADRQPAMDTRNHHVGNSAAARPLGFSPQHMQRMQQSNHVPPPHMATSSTEMTTLSSNYHCVPPPQPPQRAHHVTDSEDECSDAARPFLLRNQQPALPTPPPKYAQAVNPLHNQQPHHQSQASMVVWQQCQCQSASASDSMMSVEVHQHHAPQKYPASDVTIGDDLRLTSGDLRRRQQQPPAPPMQVYRAQLAMVKPDTPPATAKKKSVGFANAASNAVQ